MLGFLKKLRARREQKLNQKIAAQCNQAELHQMRVRPSLDENIAIIQKLFAQTDIMRFKQIQSAGEKPLRYFIVFCDGLVNSEIINTSIVKPLMSRLVPNANQPLMETLLSTVVQIGESSTADTFDKIVQFVTYGDTILFAEGCAQAAVLSSKQFALRSISEPDSEKVLGGPRDGFTESLVQNLSQVVRRLRTHQLKTKNLSIGKRTQTTVCVCYIEGLIHEPVLQDLYRRLNSIDIDGVLESNYITELIADHPYSPFPTVGFTERPDVIAGKLLEGRIAIFTDGSPIVLTVPYLFVENFQSSEDYYFNFYYSSFARILRIIAFVLTIAIPGLYIATVAFHQEMLPLQLLIRIALARQAVPLPAAVEAIIMLLVFDVLRETGVRMPSNIGQALSIVGALVIGQAAVEANLVASPMIIVVASTGITSLLVPRLSAPILFWRLILLLLAASFGFYGLTIGLSMLMIHISNLSSFGLEQISLKGEFKFQLNKDIFIRSPWPKMLERPQTLSPDRVRQAGDPDNG